MNLISRIKKAFKRALYALPLMVSGFLVPLLARADTLEFFGISPGQIIFFVLNTLANIFLTIGGALFGFGGYLIKLAFDFNNCLMSPSNVIVHVGWQITRDIANFGFVVVMLAIAFSFIIQYETFGTWGKLWKLIQVAVLINFSFAIMGVIIQFSDSISRFLLSRVMTPPAAVAPASGGSCFVNTNGFGDAMSVRLADAFGPQRFLLQGGDPLPPNPEDQLGSLVSFSSGVLMSLAGITFTIIFTVIGAFTLIGLAMGLIVRFISLTLLIITAPIAWTSELIPWISQKGKWWADFVKWVFFAPKISFFIYLALIMVDQIAKADIGNATVQSNNFFAASLGSIMIQGVQMIILCYILFMGLKEFGSSGIAGGGFALSAVNKLKTGSLNRLRKIRDRTGRRIGSAVVSNTLGTKTGRNITNFLQRSGNSMKGTWYGKALAVGSLGLIPALTGSARGLGGVAQKARDWSDATVAQGHERFDKLPLDEQMRRARNASAGESVAVMHNVSRHHNELLETKTQKSKDVVSTSEEVQESENRIKDVETRKKTLDDKHASAQKDRSNVVIEQQAANDALTHAGADLAKQAEARVQIARANQKLAKVEKEIAEIDRQRNETIPREVAAAEKRRDKAVKALKKAQDNEKEALAKLLEFEDDMDKNLPRGMRNKLSAVSEPDISTPNSVGKINMKRSRLAEKFGANDSKK